MNEKLNFAEVLARLKEIKGFAANKEVAELFGLSEPDFSRRKKQGTILPLVVAWALDNRVSLDWLLTGRPVPSGQAVREDSVVSAPEGAYGRLDADLLRTILEAVESGLGERDLVLTPAKKAQAVALLYEFYLGAAKAVDGQTVRRYLDLVAGGPGFP